MVVSVKGGLEHLSFMEILSLKHKCESRLLPAKFSISVYTPI